MRIPILLLSLLPLVAQQPAEEPHHEHPAPKNLKLLTPETLMPAMRSYTVALGVKCDFCHVPGDFASDEKHHKEIARGMIQLARTINGKFPDGKEHVTCYTCHRGSEEPATAPPPTDAPNQAPK
jgi:hypothetical protein